MIVFKQALSFKSLNLGYLLIAFLLTCFSLNTFGQTANFHANNTEGCNSLAVQFTDDSEGATSWEWDFGNGNTSILQHPKANYTSPGFYTVKLTINGTEEIVKNQYIKVYNNPAPNFTADINSGCAPLTVQLSDDSQEAEGSISSYTWLINGETISEQNPSYTFTDPGSYKITLMAVDENGCYGSLSKSKFVTVSKVPDVKFSVADNQTCELPYKPTIKNQSSIKGVADPFVYINNWKWKINNIEVSNNQVLDYSFKENGKYTISLSAQMGECTDSFEIKDAVVLNIDELDYTIERSGESYKDSILFTVKNKDLSFVKWDLGDGFQTEKHSFKYCYADSGKYDVSITAVLKNDCHIFKSEEIKVLPYPKSDFTYKQENICNPPFIVEFNNTSKMYERVLWDLGDGETSESDTSITHTYNSNGEFVVKLIAYGYEATDTLEQTISLFPNAGVQIITDTTQGCVPLEISFSTKNIVALKDAKWDFGDGNESNLPTPKHTFNKQGIFDINLTYINDKNCLVTSSTQIIAGNKPIPSFNISQTDSCNNSAITFINNSTNYEKDIWDVEDSKFIFFEEDKDTYDVKFYKSGSKSVSLKLTNHGCTSTLTKEKAIYIHPPVVDFYIDQPLCQAPATSYINNYTEQYDEISWDFGDGTKTKVTPNSHTFDKTGTYWVYQTASNNKTGCKDINKEFVHVSETTPDFELTTKNEGCLPLTVTFKDKTITTGRISNYYWDFGDGKIDTTVVGEVTHTYNKMGEFDVKLVVEESYGCRESITKQNMVKVNHTNAKIGFAKEFVCVNEEFNLINVSSSNSQITGQTWIFNGEEFSTEQMIKYKFESPGKHPAMLRVTDEKGCSNTDTLYINVPAAKALFIAGDYACTQDEWQVNNVSIGEGLSYQWNFGDGTTSTEEKPKHIFNSNSSFDVSLSVTNSYGCTGLYEKTIKTVTPSVDFEPFKTELGCARNALPAVFYDKSSDDIVKWNWNFGDNEGSESTQKDPQYLYTLPGYYDVQLTVTSIGGCTRQIKKDSLIHLKGPKGTIITDKNAGCAPLDINFTAVTDPKNTISWDVGDGTNTYDDQINFSHTYNEVRSFFPSIILVDEEGCKMEYDGDPILAESNPILSFSIPNDEVCAGTPITINGNIDLNTSQISQISEIVWDFGDLNHNNTSSQPTHVYKNTGNYDVELYVKTSIGCTATLKKDDFVTVFPSTLSASMDVSDNKICLGESIKFSNTSQSDHSISATLWKFTNDTTSSSSVADYAYTEGGIFDVKLIASDSEGCIDSTTTKIEVSSIISDFTVSPKSGYDPLEAEFINSASSDRKITSWAWDFGDNANSNEQNPKHTFTPQNGVSTFYPKLTVTDDNNCSATHTDTVYAVNNNPIAINDSIKIKEDNTGYANLSTNDSEPDGQQLIYSPFTTDGPSHGTVAIQSDGSFTYTPDENYFGTDVFEYTVCDNGIPEACSKAKVFIEILSVDDVPPVAVPDYFSVNEKDTLIGSDVLLNDIDNEGLGLNLQSGSEISKALHGEFKFNTDGTFTYTPDKTFIGKDSLKYCIYDNGTPSENDTSWIVINVLPVEEPPVAVSDNFTTNEEESVALTNLADNDTDPENNIDIESIKILEPIANGSISTSENNIVFTPEKDFYGTVRLKYSISDITLLSDTGEIIIEVNPINDAPVAQDDYANGFEDVPLSIDIISNDLDPDSNIDLSSFKLISGDVSTQHSYDSTTGILTYLPAENYIGNDVLTYEICDAEQLCSQAKVYITLEQSFDDGPITANDTIYIIQSLSDTVNVAINDTDPENDLVKENVFIHSLPESYPDVNTLEDGRIVVDYYPNPTFLGMDSLEYQICDSHDNCSIGKLMIIVKPYRESIFIPQAITPNGDGKNDYFVINNINKFSTNSIYIYNRWEHEVYSKKGYDNTWDGTSDGKPLPDGTYFYLLYLIEGDEPIKGFVYISR